MEIENYLDEYGKIKTWPAKFNKQFDLLNYLATKFEYNRIYTEKEVNQIINENHLFNDYFLLRRELIDRRFLKRTPNGAKYWKADLLKPFHTERLTVRDSTEADRDEMKTIFLSISYLEEYTGTKHEPAYIDKIITEGDLPPNGHIEFYKVKSILENNSHKLIGFIEYYLGYPNKDTLWIGSLFINKDDQQKGFGSEIIEKLTTEIKTHNLIQHIGIGVHLKNWQALRFWTKNGFKTITGIYGDKIYREDHFSIIGLSKTI